MVRSPSRKPWSFLGALLVVGLVTTWSLASARGDLVTASYEAEAAGNTLGGRAVARTCGACSGGRKVGFIGNGSANSVTVNNVAAPAAGSYPLTIHYLLSGSRSFFVSVNGGIATQVSLTGSSWSVVATREVAVSLRLGANTIRFFNNGAWAPDLDRIVVGDGAPPTPPPPTPPPPTPPPPGGTPVSVNGLLRVCGTQLCNQFGRPIQLRGMSTHGLQWYGWGDCVTEASLDALAGDWKADILRISLYVQEGGYETNPAGFRAQVDRIVEEVTERGMYALLDWHMLDPGDPFSNLARAREYFSYMAQKHGSKPNVLYEIANEPNGVSWARIKSYAEQVIPVIRQRDPDGVVIVGTRGWSSLGVSDGARASEIVNNPVNAANVMYTFHFYAASHRAEYRNELAWAAARIPVFVTEWGTQEYTGDGPDDFASAQQYLDLMASRKISWTSWNYSDDFRSGAAFRTGTCPGGPFSGTSRLKSAGAWVRDRIRNPPDDFPTN